MLYLYFRLHIRLFFVKIFTLFFSFESPKIISYYLKYRLSLNSFNLKFAKCRPASSVLLRYSVRNPANRLWAQPSER